MTTESLVTIVNNVFAQMIATRSGKYKWWLRALRYTWLPGNHKTERKGLMLFFYAAMHAADDFVDGDRPLPPGITPTMYIERKLEYIQNPEPPQDDVERLIHYSIQLGEVLDVDVKKGGHDILSSLYWDAIRRERFLQTGQLEAYPEKELHHHFDLLDIRGTIPWTLRILGEDTEKYVYLENLGLAARKYYNLRDFYSDIAAGYVNISKEDCQRLGIDEIILRDKNASPIRTWLREQATAGVHLITDHRRTLPQANFSWFGKLALFMMYEQSAQRYFKKVLHA